MIFAKAALMNYRKKRGRTETGSWRQNIDRRAWQTEEERQAVGSKKSLLGGS